MSMMIHRNKKRKKESEMNSDGLSQEETIPFYDNGIETEEGSAGKKYTRSDIQRMKKAELLEIARNTGVEGADDMTREELAEYLLNVFGV